MMTPQQIETALAALEARSNAQQKQIDAHEGQIGAIVENVNLLRGDPQRVAAEAAKRNPGRPKNQHQAPVAQAGAKRAAANAAARKSTDPITAGTGAEH